MTEVKPLDKIEVSGKKGGKEPFPVLRHHDLYFHISTRTFDRLREINDAYGSIYQEGPPPLQRIRIVGRGGLDGYRPFWPPGWKGRYLCIHAEDLKQLEEINLAYANLLELKERESALRSIEDIKKAIGGAYDAGASVHSSDLLKRAAEALSKVESAFKSSRYDEVVELAPKAKELAEDAKADALKKIEKLKEKKVEKPPEGKYVYCIIPSDGGVSFGNIGIGDGGEVYSIPYRDIAAVVSDTTMREYDLTEEKTWAHERVVATLMGDYTAVPAAFNQIFKNEKILRNVMRKAYRTLKKCLELVNNRVEYGIKAIVSKQMAKSLEGERDQFVERCRSDILEPLGKIAVESVEGRMFSERLVLNASFLVDRDRIREFSKEVGRLSEKYEDLAIKYSGPWAPYSFVYIKIGAKGVEVGRREKT